MPLELDLKTFGEGLLENINQMHLNQNMSKFPYCLILMYLNN
jgi:hypothetical protein